MVMTLNVHRLELLVVRHHRRGKAETFRERSDENPPLGLLLVLMRIIIGDLVIFSDEFFHPFEDLRISLFNALSRHIELEKAVHRRFARNKVEPVITLSLFPPIER